MPMRRCGASGPGELDLQSPVPAGQTAWLKANMPGVLHVTPSLAVAYIADQSGRCRCFEGCAGAAGPQPGL
jgi:hypothetical protein